jgi:hypothetical protein
MAAITQLIPNFLGGVSKQNDDRKLEGQVSECINGYPDPTYGLLKRPGMKFIDKLKNDVGAPFNKAALDGAVWTFIDRGAQGSYVAAIKGSAIYAWTTDGQWCTVTNTGTAYLTGTSANDYHFRSIQDTTIITNKKIDVTPHTTPTVTPNTTATLKLLTLVETFEYTVTFPAAAANNTDDVVAQVTAQNNTTFDDMLLYDAANVNANHHLIDAIKATIEAQHTAGNTNFDGIWYLEGYTNSIVIKRSTGTNAVVTDYRAVTGSPVAFNIDARGGLNNTALEVFEDEVTDISKLPLESFGGHVVRILNSDSAEDDYYVAFVAYDTTLNRGRGYWKETKSPNASAGFNASTMPHALINTGALTFTFGEINWTNRLAGDDITNPQPSFVGKKINATFFYNNRFGVLSEDNVILGVANDAYNFFAKSALTQIDSDPIDVNVSSVRPVTLTDVLPAPQGLVIFSGTQQFLILATESGVLTPSQTLVRAVSNYEMDANISPVDVGTTIAFLSKVSGYSKLFYMQLQDVDQNPTVIDISKIVLEWIPNSIDRLVVSPQNSLIALIDRQDSYIYLYRFYNNGDKDVMQAWTKWQLTGTIQDVDILGDDMIVVSQHEDEYTLNKITLDELPTGKVSITSGNSCLDMAARPFDPGTGNAVVYDSTNDVTKIYTPYSLFTNVQGTILIADPNADAGYSVKANPKLDTDGPYFEVAKDLTALENGMLIGYDYNFEVTLPKFYFRRDAQTTDFTANLTISRVNVSVGRSGTTTFKTKLTNSKNWMDVKEVTAIDSYQANSEPVQPEYQFVVPIHQRNINFELQVTSNQPYPVSLVSMMWEGNYSPRFYKRA